MSTLEFIAGSQSLIFVIIHYMDLSLGFVDTYLTARCDGCHA